MAVARHPGRSHRLYPLLAARLEQQPASSAWGNLQSPEHSSKSMDVLILRWLELNQGNPDIAILVSYLALTSASKEIHESIINWMKLRIRDQHSHFVAMHLLRGKALSENDLRPSVFGFVREWIAKNSDSEHCGSVFGDLIMYSLDGSDAENGLDWYHDHRESSFSSRVLRGLLRASALRKEAPDVFVCEEAQTVLKEMEAGDQGILLGALLAVHPDPEVIALSRKVCLETQSCSLLAILLKVAPAPELLKLAVDILTESADLELLMSALVAESSNLHIQKLARKWIRENPASNRKKELNALLA